MHITKEKINIFGMLVGLFLSVIPLYYYIRVFSSFNTIKKCGNLSKFIFASMITSIATPIVSVIVYSMALAQALRSSMYYYSVSYAMGFLVVGFVIIGLILIATAILFIITGFKTKVFLDSNKSDFLTEEERFNIAKVAGLHLTVIPFYTVYQVVKNIDMIKEVNEIISGLLIAFFILYGFNFLLSFIPVLSFLFFIALTAIMIIVGVKLNEYFLHIKTNSNEEYNQ